MVPLGRLQGHDGDLEGLGWDMLQKGQNGATPFCPFGLMFSNVFVAPVYFDLRHIMENSLSGEAPKLICT